MQLIPGSCQDTPYRWPAFVSSLAFIRSVFTFFPTDRCMTGISLIGTLAAVLTTAAYVPQAYKTIRFRATCRWPTP